MKITEKNAITIKDKLNNGNTLLMRWRWSISKATDTYGYNLCSCIIDGLKVGSCSGGNYDMRGVALGEFLNSAFKNELKQLEGFYGLSKKGEVDGGTGLNCMIKILKALGFPVKYHFNAKREEEYIINKAV